MQLRVYFHEETNCFARYQGQWLIGTYSPLSPAATVEEGGGVGGLLRAVTV